MRRNLLSFAVITLVLSISTLASAQGVEVLKGEKKASVLSEKSQIKFVSEAPAEKIVGTATKLTGEFNISLQELSNTSGKIMFPVATMDTGNKLRDKHLTSDEWLNAKANPNIIFTIANLSDIKVDKADKEKQSFSAKANGTVNVNGVDAPSSADVVVTVLASGKLKVDIAKLSVKLADHKVAGKKGVVGNKVGETIEITGLVYADLK